MQLYNCEMDINPRDHIALTVNIGFVYLAGESACRYCSDGCGYPGTGPETELVAITILDATGPGWHKNMCELRESGWGAILHKIVLREMRAMDLHDMFVGVVDGW